ncbi:hypothetical protein A1O1_08144 [Capronia coronata CBS 617.96]|uniref:BHLH domain-containing protein n=1 Tax=Capronia coronata CBS 617.96 TaxID=1182541 RepID=W9XXI4_9EURO|nr:uncharacterized protein A1O1_08144 [Capronia coronata CBS 617.96]EXJ82075.1 hypothetical protein A1O1_08144 [Capronia coronata CBS 617.96]
MPFRAAYRQYDASHDFHKQQGFHGGQPQLAIVDSDTGDYHGWHEMDFTTPLSSSMTTSAHTQKYSSNMDTDLESPAYLRPSHRQNSTSSHHQSPTISGDLYTTGPFSYSQLLNMESEISPMGQSSLSNSRGDGDSNMINDDNSLSNGTLSGSDSINASPPVSSLNPNAVSLSSKSDVTERLCPLIAGQVDSCQPQRCGPDAPCMNFTTLPPIEECTSVPCITQSTSPNETMITSDSVSVSLHQRPSLSSRTSTATTAASLRRSSTSSAENQVQSVPLPPRRSTAAAAAARRRARNSTTTSTATTTIASDDDDDDDEETTTKSTAPSKADAKQRAKQAHSLVEKKYRENLNAKIAQLHITLQSSHYGPKTGEEGESDTPVSIVQASKVRKSDVLTEAMNYVNQTEVEMRHMENEINRLSERVRVLEKLVRCEDCSLLKQMVNMQVQVV